MSVILKATMHKIIVISWLAQSTNNEWKALNIMSNHSLYYTMNKTACE